MKKKRSKGHRQKYLSGRIREFRDLLKEEKLDAYFVSNMSDLIYFTDFSSEGYHALIGKSASWLILPNLLFEQGKSHTSGFECIEGPLFGNLKKLVAKARLKKVGFDPDQLPYSFGVQLTKMGFRPVPGLIARLRAIKDALEVKRLKAANHLAARGANFVKKRLKPGKTEKRAAAELAHFFDIEGDGISFDLIVAAGPHSAFPHHIPTNYKMKAGEPVICDIGGLIEGYHSDLTRTYTLGTISPSFSRIFRIVEESQKAGIRSLKPGVTAGAVDEASRAYIKKQGYGPLFVHGTGHGVGLDIHEFPRIGPRSKDKIEKGMVVTVEPGIYLPGKFGVRIEDTLLVTSNGSVILTK